MDRIRKWLDETVLPAQPPSPGFPDQTDPAPVLPPPPAETSPKQRRRKRRGTSSDSSLIQARTARIPPSPIRRRAGSVDGVGHGACSDAHQPPGHSTTSSSSGSSSSSHKYARRPRRKTRPERYEAGSKGAKERGKKKNRHGKGESTKTRHKSRRKKRENPGVGLVQSFHAKNVSQDRLTLKPREKLGLFNKGRVSSPVKGRGLPDLVFSEMKFLQKHRVQPEPAYPAGGPKKKRKKDHVHSKEEEISAYFTSVRPALAEKDLNNQARESPTRQTIPRDVQRGRQPSSLADHAIPTIEVSDKGPSHLGFGGRGPRHDTSSYISWSKSIRAPSATSRHGHAGSGVNADHLEAARAAKDRANTGVESALYSHTPPSIHKRLTNGSGDRFFVSSSTPANQRTSRAHSYPQHTCSLEPSGIKQQTGRRHTTDTAASPSSMPAALPVHPEAAGECREPGNGPPRPAEDSIRRPSYPAVAPHRSSILDEDHSNRGVPESSDPHTSSTLGRLLQQCNTAFDDHRRQVAATASLESMVHADIEPVPISRHDRPMAAAGSFGQIRSLPTVRFSGVKTHYPPVPAFEAPNIYEEQERRLERERHTVGISRADFVDPYVNDTEMGTFGGKKDFEYLGDYGGPEWEDMPPSGKLGLDSEAGYQVEGPVQPLQAHDAAAESPGGGEVVARGFWRPNKLY